MAVASCRSRGHRTSTLSTMSSTLATGDYTSERNRALMAALELYGDGLFSHLAQMDGPDYADVALRKSASSIFTWLVGPAIMFLTVGTVVSQDTGLPVANPLGGNPMQLRDNEQVPLTVTLASARGNVIGDQPGVEDDLHWSVTGDEGVLTLDVSEDTRTATVKATGTLGSDVVRVEIGELFATYAFDVVAGNAALITIQAGEVTEQATEPEPTPEA